MIYFIRAGRRGEGESMSRRRRARQVTRLPGSPALVRNNSIDPLDDESSAEAV